MKSIHPYINAGIAILILSLASVSCKKSNVGDNDPNINDRLIDSVSVAPAPGQPSHNVPIDLDGDGLTDFFISAGTDVQGVIHTSLVGVPSYVKFVADDSGYVAPSGSNALIDSVSVVNPPKPHRWSDYALASVVAPGFSSGQANATDFYLGVFTTKMDGIHYGWLRLNVSIDGTTIRLVELACHNRPRTGIHIGEK